LEDCLVAEDQLETVERRVEVQIQTPTGSLSFQLPQGSAFVGTAEEAQIRLTDEVLEPKHLELDWDGQELWVIHLGKGHRPVVNGRLVSESRLYSGDVVELGENSMRIRILRRVVAGRPTGMPVGGRAAGEEVRVEGDALRAAGGPGGEEAGQTPSPPPVDPEEQVLLEFTVHQLVRQPRKALLLAAVLVGFVVLLWLFIVPGNWAMLLLGIAIILGSVSAFVFPVHYRLSEAGVQIRGVLLRDFKRWDRFERYGIYPDAVQLFVSQRSLRGRVLKGTLIYFGDQRDKVVEIVKSKIGERQSK
jgi:hypothetical protein